LHQKDIHQHKVAGNQHSRTSDVEELQIALLECAMEYEIKVSDFSLCLTFLQTSLVVYLSSNG
jgi:hypothetical protein